MYEQAEWVQHMSGYRVGYVVCSLSTESINRTLAKALTRLAEPFSRHYRVNTGHEYFERF
jgi:hypothetical protein